MINSNFGVESPDIPRGLEKTLDNIEVPDMQKNPSDKKQIDLDWEKQVQEGNRIKNRRLQGVTEDDEEDIADPFKQALKQS